MECSEEQEPTKHTEHSVDVVGEVPESTKHSVDVEGEVQKLADHTEDVQEGVQGSTKHSEEGGVQGSVKDNGEGMQEPTKSNENVEGEVQELAEHSQYVKEMVQEPTKHSEEGGVQGLTICSKDVGGGELEPAKSSENVEEEVQVLAEHSQYVNERVQESTKHSEEGGVQGSMMCSLDDGEGTQEQTESSRNVEGEVQKLAERSQEMVQEPTKHSEEGGIQGLTICSKDVGGGELEPAKSSENVEEEVQELVKQSQYVKERVQESAKYSEDFGGGVQELAKHSEDVESGLQVPTKLNEKIEQDLAEHCEDAGGKLKEPTKGCEDAKGELQDLTGCSEASKGSIQEQTESNEEGIQELEKEITCVICHEHYTEPKVLPCCHYYCKQCIHCLALKTGLGKPFSCPECRADTTLPQGGVDNLQAAFFINRMQALHSKLELAHGKVVAKCEVCSEDKAEAFCRQCAQFICVECMKSHQRLKKLFPGHKISTLKELRDGGAKEFAVQVSALEECQLHDQPMNIYCFDCSCLICRDCTIRDHRDHNHNFIRVAAPEIRKELIENLDPLRNMKSNVSKAVVNIKTTKSVLESQGNSVATRIENLFQKLHKTLEDRKQELLMESKLKVAQKLKCLSNQEDSLDTVCAVIQSVIDYTEHCVEHSTDDEIMCEQSGIKSRIDKQGEERHELHPVEEADIGVEVSCIEDLKQLCQAKAKLTVLDVDPLSCTCNSPSSVFVNQQAEFDVVVALSNGQPTKRPCEVACSLKVLANGSTSQCKVDPTLDEKYCVKYMPTERGRHEMTVCVNGKAIAGSPFPLLVTIPAAELGTPIKVHYMPKIRGIAVTSSGELIIAKESNILVQSKTTEFASMCLSNSTLGLSSIYGICISSESGCVFICGQGDYKYGKIVKLSSEYKIECQVTDSNDGRFWDISSVGNEIMACQTRMKKIMVYNTQLEYLRQFGSRGLLPCALSPDTQGNLFIAGGSSRIQVWSKEGKFIHDFSCSSEGMKPRGICVFGEYVYITDRLNHTLSVFTTTGKRIAVVGQQGRNAGQFTFPWGVFVDDDGFVYVCDCDNNSLKIF